MYWRYKNVQTYEKLANPGEALDFQDAGGEI